MSDVSSPPVQRSGLWRAFRFLLFAVGGLIGLLLLVCLVENWRGARAWEKFRTEMEAKGEKLDYREFIPKPVPDEQNFASTPLLAPLLDYDRITPGKWRDVEGRARAHRVSSAFSNASGKKAPQAGSWQVGTFIELDEWQDFLVGNTNFPGVARSTNSAADVIAALQRFDAELMELETASQRPHSVFPIHYEENFNALLPHLSTIKGISSMVRLRAIARLKTGQKDQAVQDVRLTLRLAESFREETFLISQLVRIAILHLALHPVWEGCARHEWTDAQLVELQSALAGIRLIEDYGRTMRAERAFSNAGLDLLITGKMSLSEFVEDQFAPAGKVRWFVSGWIRQNQVLLCRLHQERTIPLIDATKHRVFVGPTRMAENMPELQTPGPYNILARMLIPAVTKTASKFAHGQTALDLAVIACALERYRLANGEYPSPLDLIVPRFIEKIPTDIINGEMLKYRREADGSFALWSVGWDEKDNGGEPGLTKSGKAQDPNTGDWVWRWNPVR